MDVKKVFVWLNCFGKAYMMLEISSTKGIFLSDFKKFQKSNRHEIEQNLVLMTSKELVYHI
jgi:hypothetical protein